MAIKTEQVEINGNPFILTYSDANFYIERDGVKYADAVDPVNSGREYTETDEVIEIEDFGKFTPTNSASGGDGSESNPYTFVPGKPCVLNAYYTSPTKYVYMPSDSTAKSYDSWADASADMVEW